MKMLPSLSTRGIEKNEKSLASVGSSVARRFSHFKVFPPGLGLDTGRVPCRSKLDGPLFCKEMLWNPSTCCVRYGAGCRVGRFREAPIGLT